MNNYPNEHAGFPSLYPPKKEQAPAGRVKFFGTAGGRRTGNIHAAALDLEIKLREGFTVAIHKDLQSYMESHLKGAGIEFQVETWKEGTMNYTTFSGKKQAEKQAEPCANACKNPNCKKVCENKK